MQRSIQRPFYERRHNNAQTQKAGRSSGANVFGKNTLVYLTAGGLLAAVPSAGVACYGWSHGPSVTPGTEPPLALYQNVYPFDLSGDALLVMSTTNAAGDAPNNGTAATAPALSTVVIGQTYGILNPTVGNLAGVQMVNLDDTQNKLLTVVDIYPNQAGTDLNGLVLVRITPTALQA